jgi:hypothetical protein
MDRWMPPVMRRVLYMMGCVIALPMSTPASAWAQSPSVEIIAPAKEALTTERPFVRTAGIVTAPHTAELIRNGFPARLHYKMERWSAGTFVNDVKSTVEWEVIVEYDALAERFHVIRATNDRATLLGVFETLKDADAKIAEPLRVAIGLPKKGEKTYYTVKLDVEAMSLSDLDEVRRWLNGELRPAVRGRRNPGTAVTSGVRMLFVRLLGGERVQYQANTGVLRP